MGTDRCVCPFTLKNSCSPYFHKVPAVSASAHVLVTGASSFIGVWVVRQLLDAGYRVTGTVRSEGKGAYLKQLFSKYPEGRFNFGIVEDVAKPEAFDKYVVDVDAIEHLASPFHYGAEDPQELIGPAVKGTTAVLESALAHGKNVKRVVITSSLAAIFTPDKPVGYEWSEADWNTTSAKIIEEKGKDASNDHKYNASKTLAEKAAWEFVEKHKDTIKFDLTTVNPSFVFGPTLHQVKSLDALNTSVSLFQQKTLGEDSREAKKEDLAAPVGSWVDVRDVAKIHVAALGSPRAGGQRYLASNGGFTWQDVLDALAEHADVKDVPKGFPSAGKNAQHRPAVGKKAEAELGIKYHTLSETVYDTYKSLKERFYAPKASA